MKNLRICLSVVLLVSISGCDFLRYDESTHYSKEDVFSDLGRTKRFLTDTYSRLPDGFNSVGGAMRSSASDDAVEVWELSNVHTFNNGSWSAINNLDAEWGNSYTAIRATNRFLEETEGQTFEDRQYNEDYDEMMEQFQYYPYEARFLRAFFYFELIKRYGDSPLVTTVLNSEEANHVEPAPFEEIVAFIVSECDSIAPHLPVEYTTVPNQETGRATRGAAMALKARTLLYAASPLHNPEGGTEKWEAAAVASKAIIDSSWYLLLNNYGNIPNNRNNNELILGRRLGGSNFFERSNFPIGYEGAEPGTAPTQNLVEAYDMQSTGSNIDDAGSGYDPANPYQDRDPRLAQTIILNNSQWKGQTVEIWNGGRNGPPQERATKTGYYLKKHVIQGINLDPANTTTQVHTWILFRYGEVLLNYAEAMNEAYGPDDPAGMGMTAREAVNLIRDRSNMPLFNAGMTQDEFRRELRNERRVELAFEDHRFWDIRRWKIGPSTTDIYGVGIVQESDGSFTYTRKLVEERVWDDKMYLYPIPQSEVFKNEALGQNPGW